MHQNASFCITFSIFRAAPGRLACRRICPVVLSYFDISRACHSTTLETACLSCHERLYCQSATKPCAYGPDTLKTHMLGKYFKKFQKKFAIDRDWPAITWGLGEGAKLLLVKASPLGILDYFHCVEGFGRPDQLY